MAGPARKWIEQRRRIVCGLLLILGLAASESAAAPADPTQTLANAGWQTDKLPSGGLTYVCEQASCNGPALMLYVSRPVGEETLAHLRAGGDDFEAVVRRDLLGLDGPAAAQWPFLSIALKEADGHIEIVVKGFYTGKAGNPSDSGKADSIILVHIHAGVAKAITSIAASPSAAAINLSVARAALEVDAKP